jgi:hypothetical protein
MRFGGICTVLIGTIFSSTVAGILGMHLLASSILSGSANAFWKGFNLVSFEQFPSRLIGETDTGAVGSVSMGYEQREILSHHISFLGHFGAALFSGLRATYGSIRDGI